MFDTWRLPIATVPCTLTRASRLLRKKSQHPRRLPSPAAKRARELRAVAKHGNPEFARNAELHFAHEDAFLPHLLHDLGADVLALRQHPDLHQLFILAKRTPMHRKVLQLHIGPELGR